MGKGGRDALYRIDPGPLPKGLGFAPGQGVAMTYGDRSPGKAKLAAARHSSVNVQRGTFHPQLARPGLPMGWGGPAARLAQGQPASASASASASTRSPIGGFPGSHTPLGFGGDAAGRPYAPGQGGGGHSGRNGRSGGSGSAAGTTDVLSLERNTYILQLRDPCCAFLKSRPCC